MLVLAVTSNCRLNAQEGDRTRISVVRSRHLRLPLPADVQRFAVGNPDTLSVEPLNTRELLLLGKAAGQTSLLVWFRDGSIQEYIVAVHRDIALLQDALKRIYPTIEAEIAPDRDSVVLTGRVPDLTYSRAAEAAAHNYLDAAPNLNARILIQDQQQPNPSSPQTQAAPGTQAQPLPAPEVFRLPQVVPVSATVINLISVDKLPPILEDKILDAIHNIGGSQVTVQRIVKGLVRDDALDVFLLRGHVSNQVALTRVLTIAADLVTGQALNVQAIQVVADESGALGAGGGGAGAGGGGAGAGGGGAGAAGGGGGLGGGGLGGGGGSLGNQLRSNIARAKALRAAGGRILSFIEVADIPQVRVDIRLVEIDRTKLKNYSPNIGAVLSTQKNLQLTPPQNGILQGRTPLGPGTAAQNLLGFLGGALSNQTQLTASHFLFDSVLTYLEQVGIARSLSSPSLTVLSGELALFQVGGTIPIPLAFAPAFGGAATAGTATPGVFSSVEFLSFGIQLNVRPLVGDDDTVTVDLQPQITTPDTNLTNTLRSSTGNNQVTTAFQTRSLRTSARLQDGQALILGGLLSNTASDSQGYTPGLQEVPGLGWLFKNLSRTDDTTELVVVVNPSIVRDRIENTALWEFPGTSELFEKFGKGARITAPLGGTHP